MSEPVGETTATIAAVETATVSLHAKPALAVRSSRTTHDASTFVIVRVTTSEGVSGYGEVSATAAWSGEDHVTATHFIRELIGPALVGRPLAPAKEHVRFVDRFLGGNPFTKGGVDTALWDALGRTLGVPVAELLGGPFRREVPVKVSLSGDGDDLVRGYETAVGLGFHAFKVKVGRDPEADAARVALARSLAGPDAHIGADANGGWSRADAERAIRALEPSRLGYIEQPVSAADLEGMAQLRALGLLPVVADEAAYSEADVERIARAGAADIVNVYVGKSSGPGRAVRAAALAASHGLGVVIGSNGEMGIGAAAQLHVACACEQLGPIPCGIIGDHFYEGEPTLATPLDIDGRRAVLTTGPGLGVEPAADIARRFSA